MKPIMRIIMIAGVASLTLMAGCKETIQQSVADAKGSARKDRQALEQEKLDAQYEYLDDWTAFRSQAEHQILTNANGIDELKRRVAAGDGAYRQRVTGSIEELALTNRALLKKLDGYKDEGKVNWDVFRRDFARDMDILSGAIKNLAADNK